MTEFEKRFPDSVGNSGSQITISRKEGWTEALEWLQKSRGKHIKDGVDVIIENELEELK